MFMLMAMILSISGWSQETVTIGTGTETQRYVPLYAYYENSAAQTIYLADEVGMSGVITSISYYATGNSATRNVVIYMGETTLSSFTSVDDALTNLTEVYSGSVTFSASGWTTITFETPFAYTGTNNLVVGVRDITGSWTSAYPQWQSTTGTGRSIYSYQDGSPVEFSAMSDPYYYSVSDYYPNIQLSILPEGADICYAPATITVGNVETNAATVSWTMNENNPDASVNLQYALSSVDWDDEEAEITTVEGLTGTEYEITGLTGNTTYKVRIQADCGSSISSWKNATFTTACDVITDFPWEEGFENTWTVTSILGGVAPNCWAVYNGGAVNTSTYNPDWMWGYSTTSHSGSGAAACYTDYNYGPENHNDWLVSPLLPLDDNRLLTFWAQRASSTTSEPDEISIWISDEDIELTAPESSSDPLPGFTQIYQTDIPQGEWQLYEVPLTEYSGNRYIAFVRRNTPTDGWYLRLDDVKVDEMPACLHPTDVELSEITGHTVTIAWEGDADVISYKTEDAEEWESVEVSESPYTLEGLTGVTDYILKVGLTCSDGNVAYATENTFTTDVTCPVPVITIEDLTSESISISWTGDADQYTLNYKLQGSTDYINEEPIELTENTYTIEDLETTTAYTIEIQANCGEEDGDSQQGTLSFTTTQVAVDLPYSTNFSGDEETGDRAWLFTNGTYSNYWAFGSLGTNEDEETVYGMFVTTDGTTPGYNNGSTSTVTTEKAFNVGPEGQIHIEFDVQVGGEGTYTPYDYLKVFLAPAAWSEALSSYSYSNSTYAMDFSDYLSQTGISSYPYKLSLTQGNTIHISQDMMNPNPNGVVKLVFLWRNDGTSGTQPAANISNVEVSMVACSAPASINVSGLTDNSATVTLPEGFTYVVEYKESSNTDEDAWTPVTANENVAQITGLEAGTYYTVRAAVQCEENISEYIYRSFFTNCVTVEDFPYYESFENGTEINPFACWTVENASTSNENVWMINSYDPQDGDYMAYMPWNPGSSSRLISPVFDLSSLSSPYLSFFYITGGYEDYYSGDIAVSTLAVYYKTEETTEWTQLGTTYDTELEDWTYASIALPEGTTQVMFLGEGNDGNGVYLDNISIMSIACDAPTNPALSNITGHTVTVAWEGDADVLQYKLATAEEWETETISESPFTLTGLAPESNYVVRVGATCDNGEISYAPNLQFTTDISCPAPVITLTDVTTSTATVTWTGEADSYTVSLKNAATNEFVEGAEEITVSENEYTFEDLTSTTTYTVSVKADCGEEDGESEVATLSFSTTMESVDLPYSTDFSGDEETGDRGWLFTNGTYSNYWAFGSLGTNAGGETVYGMFVTTDGTTPGYNNGSASTVITEKTFNVGPEGQIHVEFDANVGGEGTGSYSVYDYLKVFLAPATWSDALTSYTAGNYNDYAMNFADYLSQTGSSYFPYKLNLTQGNTIHISQDITNPDPNGVVKLVFLWRNDNSSGTQPAANISNVSVSMVSCSAPAFVTVSNVAARTATVTLPEEGNFVVEYKTAADEDWTEATVVDNVATLTGLTPETSYSVRAASLCGEDQLSSYVTASFTTTVACPAPVVTVSATTANSAIISYTGDAESYELKYKAAAEEDWTTETITENPYTIENLTPSTSYTLELRANCGEEDGMSSAGTASFTTACVAVTDFPYEEGFEAGLGCWTSEIVVGTSDWATRTSYNGTTVYQGSQFVAIPNGRNRIARLVSPIFNLSSAESPVLTFAHIQKEWSGDQDTLGLYYRTSAEEDWTYITSWNQNISEWTVETINLPEPSATYQIAFLGYGDWGYGAGVDAINITTGTTPEPVQPTVATNAATEVSQTSAVLNGAITEAGNQTITAIGFEWKLASATGYNTLEVMGSEFTANLTGLTANTSYTYRAFATTALGTVYGSELTFTTLEQGDEPCTPVAMTITETVCYGETYTFNGQTYNATGTYTTTVAGQGTDCDTNYTINLTVLPQNTASETVTVCAGTTATFNGQTLTEGTNTITVSGQGTECDTLYTVTLVVLQPTSSTVEATICAGETYEFNGNTYNATGTYTATLVNAAGCDSTVTLNLTVRPANTPIEETVTLNNNELPYEYQGQEYTAFGTYQITGEDEYGCPQEYVLTLVHNSGIAEVENEYSIALYPNPTTSNATLSVKGLNEEATVIVTDQAGRVISTSTLALGQETMEVETSKLASGVYYIRIQTANSVRTEKLIRK